MSPDQETLFPVATPAVRTEITYAQPDGALLTADDFTRLAALTRSGSR
ncbi:hypothetical protein [Streptomyces lydicus]|nr:hypothetical protein [Streptomyces lydicus]MCZ1012138.1 hypothetical protein [Streptomyces lydicus]